MRNLNRYPLAALRALEAVGRLGGLSAAAEELGVTAGAVSQHIRKAEAQLGRAVFERTARGLAPTPVGVTLLEGLTRGFGEMARAVAAAEGRRPSALTISVAPVLAAKWLVPRLNRFHARHPKLRLRIDASVQLVDFDAAEIDAAVRVGKGPWPNVRAVKLAPLQLFPVCSPALAERLLRVEDLATLPIIEDHGSPGRWRFWLAAQGAPELPLSAGPTYSDAALCLDAAIAGQGVAMAWPTLAIDALRAGVLKAPFPKPAPADEHYWLVTSRARPMSAPIRAFERWLSEELAADCVV